jgi:hypothetical protein
MAWVGEAGLGYGVVLGRCLLIWGKRKEEREVSTLGKKENSMESPTLAFMSLGENVRAPLPASTEMVAAVATAADAAAARAVGKYMLRVDMFSSECLLKEFGRKPIQQDNK